MSISSRWGITGLSLVALMSPLDTSIANAALPVLARAFSASFESVRWVVLVYLLALTPFTAVAGRLGDVVGRRHLLLIGTAAFTIASLVCGVAPTLTVLLAARSAQGLGAAGMMALAVAAMADTVPAARTGRAMGLLGTMSALGTTLGPSLGGLLTAHLGWQAIFLVNVPIGSLALLLVYRFVPADRPSAESTRRTDTLAELALLGRPAIAATLAASLVVAMIMMTTLVVGPFYLARTLGLGAATAGFVLSIGPVVAVLGGLPAGWLVDRFGARRMTIAGLGGLAAGAALLGVLPGPGVLFGYVAPIVAMTSSYALFQAANNTLLTTTVDSRARGVAAGMLGLARNVGLIGGAWVMGTVFAWAVGGGDATLAPPEAVAAGVRITFRIAASLIGVTIVATLQARSAVGVRARGVPPAAWPRGVQS